MNAPRKSVSVLTVLAAMGASGMVAEVVSAAPVELEPTMGARGKNSSYIGQGFPENWTNWLAETGVTYHLEGPAFTTWNIDFGAGTVISAEYRIDKNGGSYAYGIPAGATLNFALITEPWSPGTPDPSQYGPSYGTTLGTDFVQIAAPADDPFNADITTLLQTWQANPTAYYGIRFSVSSGADRGGVWAPNDTDNSTGITANLVLDQQVVPEPGALSILGISGLLTLRRRRT